MIDGGTEGFKGHVRIIKPGITSCFECTLDMFPPQENFPLCTLAEIPRTAAHCIEWARIIRWSEVWPNKDLDLDDPECMKWIYETALGRAEQFGITGVTYQYTQGVAKHIIPAIASTNAVVAAVCATEAFKLATGVSANLDDYMIFTGAEGTYTSAFKPDRKEDCLVCSNVPVTLDISRHSTLSALLELLKENPKFQCKEPSIAAPHRNLYMRSRFLEAQTRPNLDKEVGDLVEAGMQLTVTDPHFIRGFQLILEFTD